MTKPREKTREELQAEVEDRKKKLRQLENREKVLRQKLSKEERRTRSRRLHHRANAAGNEALAAIPSDLPDRRGRAGDTVKPRLMEAEADLDRVLVIDEAKRELTLSDERIEKAITQNGARLIILDPIQAYMGEKTDMNRANEVRPMFRRLADVAERTGCAVILIGHLNKAAGGQSAYRGLGSIDFRAAARSVLLIGRVKREPNVRVIVHDKSSLAPEGKPIAFCLDPETGFSWIGEYDITADELLSGAGGNNATKTEQAERLILDLLADGKELASEDIVKAAAEAGISERTVQNAKRNIGGILGARRVGGQWYNFIKKKQPPESAS